MDATKHEIREFIAKSSAGVASVGDAESLLDAGIVDSLGVLELVGFLETRYGITVADEEMMPENFGSIEAIAEFVARRCSGAGVPR
jgi:acyl carrier protein